MNASAAPAPAFPFFGGHRWVFWPIALIPAATLLLSFHFHCMKNDSWPTPLLLIFMLMACLWEAHAQALRMGLEGKGMLWHVFKRTLKTLRSVIFSGLLPFVLVGIILPQYSCYINQSRVTAAIANTFEPRQEIERRASVNKTLKGAGLGLKFPILPESLLSGGFVLEDGVIVLVMEKPPAAVLLTPQLVDAHSGAIKWSCRGYPAKSMPARCRKPG